MLKGDYDYITVPLGVVITVGLIVAIVLVVQAVLLSRAVDLQNTEKSVQAVDASKIVYNCLEEKGGDMISGDTLVHLGVSDNMCSLCRICSMRVGASIEYLEGPKKGASYDIDYIPPVIAPGAINPGTVPAASSHTIFVNVNDSGNVYVSKMTVFIY